MLLHDLFLGSAKRWPHAIAIEVPPGNRRPSRCCVSYGQLRRDALLLAERLRPLIAGECTVAVLLPRSSHHLAAAQLAILIAGAGYVCLDDSFPPDYATFVLADSGAVALLTDVAGASRLQAQLPPGRTIDVAAVLRTPYEAPAADPAPPPWLGGKSLAYVIYTSGTTGKPKGVMIEHGSVSNLIRSDAQFRTAPGDRVAQGSSAAYDSSVEELWLALAYGATAVLLDDETVRLGPDLVPWLRQERITVFCPPPTLLRAMSCRDPVQELPDLRLCYIGGEAMPQDLSDLWARSLWLENGYGPTECTVTVARGRLQPGTTVHIGTAVPGNRALLLDAAGNEVPPGSEGELCFQGQSLARGYLGRPELTAERFPVHPAFGRIYRTGDLARRQPDGTLLCLGRIDAQVKLRGHRIELEAVESVLARCRGVREAACRVQGQGAEALLAGYLVAGDGATPPLLDEVLDEVRSQLPGHMVPARLMVCTELPRTLGGKLDRRSLPDIAVHRNGTASHHAPHDPLEQRIAAAFAARLGLEPPPDADFFASGGDSLRAAQMISDLRDHESTASLTVRDVYQCPTVRLLAQRARSGRRRPGAALARVAVAQVCQPLLVTAAQTVWLLGALAGAAALFYGIGFHLLPALYANLGPVPLLLLLPAISAVAILGYTSLSVVATVLTKQLLIGRYRPLREPVWSWFYLRHWIVQHTAQFVPWNLLAGTGLQCMALRALGARIGERVHLHRGVNLALGGWDLLDIGNDVSIGRDAHLGLVELEEGCLVIGPLRIGAGSTLDVRAGVGPGACLEPGAYLTALSSLPAGGHIPAGECWDGVPAQRIGPSPEPAALTASDRELSPWQLRAILLAVQLGLWPLLALPLCGLGLLALAWLQLDASAVLKWIEQPLSKPSGIALLSAITVGSLPFGLALQALVLRWLPKVPAGTHGRWGSTYLWLWLRTGLLESAGTWLAGSLYWPLWLRLAGMRIGRKCEVSTILDVLPEHLSVGNESFLADGIYLGVPRVHRGRVTVLPTSLGNGTFVGNHVVVHAGQHLPDNLVLGVCTVADDRLMTAGTGWFGHPPFQLPRREVIQVDRRLTHEPSPLRWCHRLFWESLRFAMPALPVALLLCWVDLAADATATFSPAVLLLVILPALTLGATAVITATAVAAKWALLGRVRPGQHALWSCWASRWDFFYMLWDRYARLGLLQLEGTLLLGFCLRAAGVRLGKGVVLGPGFSQLVDPDMMCLEDGATVDAMFQAHSFEDRVLKLGLVRVGEGATACRASVLLYGAEIGAGARVAPHSVVMKHERLLPGQGYAGVPTAPVG